MTRTASEEPRTGVARDSVAAMYAAMVGIGALCGLIVVSVFQWTAPAIERNRAEALERAIREVLPAARSSVTFRLDDDARFRVGAVDVDETRRLHAGYDADGLLVGLAVEAAGMGYQDVIRLLYGYSFENEAIIGIRVLESKETPGLGDRIESDPEFLENFRALDVGLDDARVAIVHPIEATRHGRKEHAWQVDGITGATISSVAVADILRVSTIWWLPRIRAGLDDLRDPGDAASTGAES